MTLRREHSIFRRESWRDGLGVSWFNAGGGEQTDEQWQDPGNTTVGLRLSRDVTDEGFDDVLILFNPHDGTVPFKLPEREGSWIVELTTSDPERNGDDIGTPESYDLESRSLTVLRGN
jgi:glycogen operon protein